MTKIDGKSEKEKERKRGGKREKTRLIAIWPQQNKNILCVSATC